MAEVNTTNAYVVPDRRSVLGTVLTGLVVGVVGWLLSLAIQTWIIDPVFCRSPQTFAVCVNGGTIGWVIAMILVSIASLLSLVRNGVFRPLLVVLASLIALWGASAWLGPLAWWQGMLWHGVLFALAYALFAWVARLSNFLIAVIVTIVLIVAARLVVIGS